MHSNAGYIDQNAEDLRLTLVEGDLDHTQFHVFASQQLVLAEIRIRATIIGASHVITYDTGSYALHEMFACVDLPNVSNWPVEECRSVQRQLPDYRYEFAARRVPWTDCEPVELVDLVQRARHAATHDLGLIQEFPKGELMVTPKTVIVGSVDAAADRIVIETAHSYPNERGLVMSRSILTSTLRRCVQ